MDFKVVNISEIDKSRCDKLIDKINKVFML